MNRALWRKAYLEARWMMAGSTLLLFAFMWIFVWVTSLVKLGALRAFLEELPPGIQGLAGVPMRDIATVAGRISLSYVDPVLLAICALWGISRGSDAVSGEIHRGTMEMLLGQPLRRIEVLAANAAMAIGGAVLLSVAAWLGTAVGIWTVTLEETVAPSLFVPAALNVFALVLFLAGTTTLVSACDQYRWRTIGVMGTFFLLSLVVQILARMAPPLNWLKYFTFLAAYEPQVLISDPASAWSLSMQYDGLLLGLGIGAYLLAAAIFCRRDIPAPL